MRSVSPIFVTADIRTVSVRKDSMPLIDCFYCFHLMMSLSLSLSLPYIDEFVARKLAPHEIFIGHAVHNLLVVLFLYLIFVFPYQILDSCLDSYWTGAKYHDDIYLLLLLYFVGWVVILTGAAMKPKLWAPGKWPREHED